MKVRSVKRGMCVMIIFGLAIIGLSCNSRQTKKVLQDDTLRGELYSEILNDHAYLREFMDSMARNDHAQIMIRADKAFQEIVMRDSDAKTMMEHMIAKVENDSAKTKEMCSMMMKNKSTKKSMMEVMKEKATNDAEKGTDPEKHEGHH